MATIPPPTRTQGSLATMLLSRKQSGLGGWVYGMTRSTGQHLGWVTPEETLAAVGLKGISHLHSSPQTMNTHTTQHRAPNWDSMFPRAGLGEPPLETKPSRQIASCLPGWPCSRLRGGRDQTGCPPGAPPGEFPGGWTSWGEHPWPRTPLDQALCPALKAKGQGKVVGLPGALGWREAGPAQVVAKACGHASLQPRPLRPAPLAQL